MNYLEHFGFQKEPFSLSPAAGSYYNSASHASALRKLGRMIDGESGAAVVVGVPGVGKTTLALQLLAQSSPDLHAIAYVACGPQSTFSDILSLAALQLRTESVGFTDLPDAVDADAVVVLLDDADHLSDEVIGELVKNAGNCKFVFFAATAPKSLLEAAEQISLLPLDERGTRKYIAARLRMAGGRPATVPPPAVARVHQVAAGVPMLINRLMERMLVAAATSGTEQIDEHLAQAVSRGGVASVRAAAGVAESTEAPDEITVGATSDDDEQTLMTDDFSQSGDLADDELDLAMSALDEQDFAPEETHEEVTFTGSDVDTDTNTDTGLASDVGGGDDDSIDDELAMLAADLEGDDSEAVDVGMVDDGDDDVDALLAQFESENTEDSEFGMETDLEEGSVAEFTDANIESELADLDAGLEENDDASVDMFDSDDNADIDNLLSGLEDRSAESEISGSEIEADDDIEVDALLDELQDSDSASLQDEGDDADIDSLLDQLDKSPAKKDAPAKQTDTQSSGDADLDDLLSQIDELQDI